MNHSRLDGAHWHFREDAPSALGCVECFLRKTCGTLQVKGSALDCQRFCCHQSDCKIVCFNSPSNYARRLKEIGGFELNNIPRCSSVNFERLRGYVPLIHHAYSRSKPFKSGAVALSLYELLDRHGAPKYFSIEDVARNFRISSGAKLLISGIHKDYLLERVWRSSQRNSIALMLRSLGVSIFTPPNFSVYNNVPRPENLYNIKRIGLLSQEFLSAGVPTALHINACTDTDYDRYGEFLTARNEFEAISFDFITGPGYPSRMPWHTNKLIELRNRLGRNIQLVLRGGTRALPILSAVYSDIVIIDSDPLHRALHRQRMIFGNDGLMKVVENHLPKGVPIDDLFVENVIAARSEVVHMLHHPNVTAPFRRGPRKLPRTRNKDNESRQLDLLANSSRGKPGVDAIDSKRVIAATKPEGATEIQEATKQIAKSPSVS